MLKASFDIDWILWAIVNIQHIQHVARFGDID